MRIYEELFIMKPDAPEEEVDQFIEQMKTVVTTAGGTVDKVDKWGKRRLAYRVDKYREGAYVLFQFSSGPETVKEFERRLRVSDLVIKFLTVRIDETLKRLEKRKKDREKRAHRKATRGPGPGAAVGGAADAGRAGAGGVSEEINHGGIQRKTRQRGAAAHRRRQGRRHPEEAIFPAQESVPLLRREDRRHQLQGRAHAQRSFIAERGKIVPRRISGVCAPHQRRLSDAIKKARNIALLPFARRQRSNGE